VKSAATSKLAEWRENPVAFAREVLKVEPDAWQAEVLQAFPTHNRIALKASKGPGKSTVMAWCAWNFLLTRPHPKVVATSITGDNLKDGLWTEMSKWQQRSDLLLKAFKWSSERIVCIDHPETWWASARQWSKAADANQQANTLAGIHAEYVLFLVDEAGGIPDAVVSAAEGGLASGTETKLFLAGNPTELSGPLYRACTRERAMWFIKEISGDPDDPLRAPRVNIQWARDQIAKYGRDNPWVLVNVFGKFPPGQSNTLIPLETATEAARRSLGESEYRDEPKVLGVDVAGFGDDRTVIQARQGRVALRPTVLRTMDTQEIADRVAFMADRWKPDGILVDMTGIGQGVHDRLLALGHGPLGIHGSNSPIATEPRFLNRRVEMWWNMGQWLKSGCIPDDSELISELSTPTYKFNAGGELQLEAKADMKKRLGASPDKADALALTFAVPIVKRPVDAPGRQQLHRALTEYDPHVMPYTEEGGHAVTEYDPF
jgi:phage terminase large subunit